MIGTNVQTEIPNFQRCLRFNRVAENVAEVEVVHKSDWVVGEKKVHVPAGSMVVLPVTSSAYLQKIEGNA